METKRIKLAIIINSEREWLVEGWNVANDKERVDEVNEKFTPNAQNAIERVYFIEADVPVPIPGENTIQGHIVQKE